MGYPLTYVSVSSGGGYSSSRQDDPWWIFAVRPFGAEVVRTDPIYLKQATTIVSD